MSRKLIIPSGLIENPNQDNTIQIPGRISHSRGNLITRRQGNSLVAHQLPEWDDELSCMDELPPQQATYVCQNESYDFEFQPIAASSERSLNLTDLPPANFPRLGEGARPEAQLPCGSSRHSPCATRTHLTPPTAPIGQGLSGGSSRSAGLSQAGPASFQQRNLLNVTRTVPGPGINQTVNLSRPTVLQGACPAANLTYQAGGAGSPNRTVNLSRPTVPQPGSPGIANRTVNLSRPTVPHPGSPGIANRTVNLSRPTVPQPGSPGIADRTVNLSRPTADQPGGCPGPDSCDANLTRSMMESSGDGTEYLSYINVDEDSYNLGFQPWMASTHDSGAFRDTFQDSSEDSGRIFVEESLRRSQEDRYNVLQQMTPPSGGRNRTGQVSSPMFPKGGTPNECDPSCSSPEGSFDVARSRDMSSRSPPRSLQPRNLFNATRSMSPPSGGRNRTGPVSSPMFPKGGTPTECDPSCSSPEGSCDVAGTRDVSSRSTPRSLQPRNLFNVTRSMSPRSGGRNRTGPVSSPMFPKGGTPSECDPACSSPEGSFDVARSRDMSSRSPPRSLQPRNLFNATRSMSPPSGGRNRTGPVSSPIFPKGGTPSECDPACSSPEGSFDVARSRDISSRSPPRSLQPRNLFNATRTMSPPSRGRNRTGPVSSPMFPQGTSTDCDPACSSPEGSFDISGGRDVRSRSSPRPPQARNLFNETRSSSRSTSSPRTPPRFNATYQTPTSQGGSTQRNRSSPRSNTPQRSTPSSPRAPLNRTCVGARNQTVNLSRPTVDMDGTYNYGPTEDASYDDDSYNFGFQPWVSSTHDSRAFMESENAVECSEDCSFGLDSSLVSYESEVNEESYVE